MKQKIINILREARELGGITDEMLAEKIEEVISEHYDPKKTVHYCPMNRENCDCGAGYREEYV